MALGLSWLSWLVLLAIVVGAYLMYMSWYWRHFRRQGVPIAGPWLPLLGTSLRIFKEGMVEGARGNHEKYGKTHGGFVGRRPMLFSIDPEILRQVFIKDHASFPHRFGIRTGDALGDTMLQNVTDYAHWKSLRSTMTPTFSSGKLKRMMKQINLCAGVYAGHLRKEARDGRSLEMKEFAGSFTMDVIASTAFGLELNTKDDRDNPFVQQAKKAFDIKITSPIILILVFFPFLFPLLRPFKFSFFDQQCKEFFTDITNQILDSRKESDSKGNVDFIQLMMEAHRDDEEEGKENTTGKRWVGGDEEKEGKEDTRGKKRALTRQEIISQGVIFFLAGYDTTATTISFLAYNLACNPDQQNKLIAEIHEVMGGRQEVTDEDLHNMPYLDMCVSESLRMYPPAVRTDRIAARDVVLKGIHMPKGSMIVAPIYHMHHNADIYPQPEAFIPERYERAIRNLTCHVPYI
jgi:cytochrome P450